MKQEIYDLLLDNPIIISIRDDEELKKCITIQEPRVVFVLYGEIVTISSIVERLKKENKTVFVHMDLVAGLSAKEEAVDFIKQFTKADGIISTKFEQIKRAKHLGLASVYRVFVIDSKIFSNLNRHIAEYADAVEILPGLMPKIIKKMKRLLNVPIIAGGLISDREDVIQALDAGAIAISSTNEAVWRM